MKSISFRLAAALTCLVLHCIASAAYAIGQARADYRNLSSSQGITQQKNPGVACFNGYIKGSQTQTANTIVLQECAFGQAFSQWYPSDTYAPPIIASVTLALYPTITPATTRAAIEGSGKPFRYKWLLYNGTGSDVTSFDATSVAGWFTQADRDSIAAQIAELKVAIAASPLDTSLRNLLLDIYYDLAVAEMQAVKPQLALLARYHLGIEVLPPNKFIIDKEIDTYTAIDAAFKAAVAQFAALLSTPFPDIDPSTFDNRVLPGVPMGQYLFRREQARRNSAPSQYANASGIQTLPTFDGSAPSQTLFTGYKDLKTLLQIVGQRQQHLASLCRLLGTRQAPGDLALARESLIQATGSDGTDLQIIKSWFPELFPANLSALTPAQTTSYELLQQQSGVLAAVAGLEAARIDLMSITPFLNGNFNVLGYDPTFLLLVQDQTNQVPPLESYDTLRTLLTGTNQPLTVALNKIGTVLPPAGAIGLYQSFLEKVDRVAADIDAADEALGDRFFAITGFDPDPQPGLPGYTKDNPNPTAGSELGGALAAIVALETQAQERKVLTTNFDTLLAENADQTKAGFAQQGVSLAQGKNAALQGAVSTYKDKTGGLYDSNTAAKASAATAQALADGIYAAGTSPFTFANIGVGAANAVIQGTTAGVIARNEKYIDYAGIELSAATAAADVPLAVNQARLELESLKRDQIANNMAIQSDTSALKQALALKASLLSELARIEKKRDVNVTVIRKKSYADPIHYQRAEAALIDADESFATAQRWMFYALQALNYKWHGKFAMTQGSKSYDSSSVFRCRNALELNDLLTQMIQWDQIRVTQTTSSPRIYTRISLRDHIIARNPNRFGLTDSSDPGTRADDTATPPVEPLVPLETQRYFRKVLALKFKDAASGNLVIPFSTVFKNQAADRVDGNFFRGATYDAAGVCLDQGFWREKIEYVKVNIIAENAPVTPSNLSGACSYGGTAYFHTRVPPRSNRSVGGLAVDDAPGELLATSFRFWSTPDFSQTFKADPNQLVSIPVAYSRSSAVVQVDGQIQDNLGSTFQINAFAGRSIAASGWKLSIDRVQSNGFVVDASNIKDIEIIIAYKHSDRVFPPN